MASLVGDHGLGEQHADHHRPPAGANSRKIRAVPEEAGKIAPLRRRGRRIRGCRAMAVRNIGSLSFFRFRLEPRAAPIPVPGTRHGADPATVILCRETLQSKINYRPLFTRAGRSPPVAEIRAGIPSKSGNAQARASSWGCLAIFAAGAAPIRGAFSPRSDASRPRLPSPARRRARSRRNGGAAERASPE